ncbi:hypothetical protein, partial [Mesorhizobium sp. YR577]|uniref:hypothetical protein n=1 Tax=Mesorhizobium sp. YR577 TaxID=1884373 RepID=UPI001AECB5ED
MGVGFIGFDQSVCKDEELSGDGDESNLAGLSGATHGLVLAPEHLWTPPEVQENFSGKVFARSRVLTSVRP